MLISSVPVFALLALVASASAVPVSDSANVTATHSAQAATTKDIFPSHSARALHIQPFVDKLLHEASAIYNETSAIYNETSEKLQDLKSTVYDLVSSTSLLKTEVEQLADKHGITLSEFTTQFSNELVILMDPMLMKQFSEIEGIIHHTERERFVLSMLDQVEGCLVKILVQIGSSEEHASGSLEHIKPILTKVLVTIGDLVEQHPVLSSMISIIVMESIAHQAWFLRPIFKALSFGLSSAIEGSIDA